MQIQNLRNQYNNYNHYNKKQSFKSLSVVLSDEGIPSSVRNQLINEVKPLLTRAGEAIKGLWVLKIEPQEGSKLGGHLKSLNPDVEPPKGIRTLFDFSGIGNLQGRKEVIMQVEESLSTIAQAANPKKKA